jgi:tellurite resistance protein
MRFVAPQPTPKGLARRVPPAVFVPVMGLLGLGLAWRQAAEALGLLAEIGEALLGAFSLLAGFCLAAYAAKAARRPGVVAEDLAVLPGRLGLSAMAVTVYLLAAALAPVQPGPARLLLWAGMALHAVLLVTILRVLLRQPPESRRFSPSGHLYFTSPVVAAMAAASLGEDRTAGWLLTGSLAVASVIWLWGALDLLRRGIAAPLRPPMMLHLAAAAVAGNAALRLDWSLTAQAMTVLTLLLAAGLAAAARWLTEAPFSALWGAFTFPVAATATFLLAAGGPLLWPGIAALVLASALIPVIAYRILRMWIAGSLAVKTNAASA